MPPIHLTGASLGATRPTDYHFRGRIIGPPEVLRMYLGFATDPSTDAVVTWHDNQEQSRLEYREAGEYEWHLAPALANRDFPGRPEIVHSAALTDLSPDTEYTVRVVGSEFTRKIHTINPSATVKLAVVSDCQTNGFAAANSQWREINTGILAQSPDILIANGDYLSGNGVASSANSTRWAAWLDVVSEDFLRADGTMIPMVWLIGNHDAEGQNSGGSFLAPGDPGTLPYLPFLFDTFYRAGANVGGAGWGWFAVGQRLLVLCLDTNHATPLSEQIDWFTATLATKAADYDQVVVVSHMPPISATYFNAFTACIALRREFLPVANQYPNLKIWLAGHDHMALASLPLAWSDTGEAPYYGWAAAADGLRMFGGGGWGAPTSSDSTSADLVGIGDAPWPAFVCSRNEIVGTPTNAPIPSGTTTDRGAQNWWLLDVGAEAIRARCYNIEGTTYYDEEVESA